MLLTIPIPSSLIAIISADDKGWILERTLRILKGEESGSLKQLLVDSQKIG